MTLEKWRPYLPVHHWCTPIAFIPNLISYGKLALQNRGCLTHSDGLISYPHKKLLVEDLLTKLRNENNNGKLNENRNEKLLETRIETKNIRTFYKAGATKNIVENVVKYKIPIVVIQEVRGLENGNDQSRKSSIMNSGKKTCKHAQEVIFVINNSIMSGIKMSASQWTSLLFSNSCANFDMYITYYYASTGREKYFLWS